MDWFFKCNSSCCSMIRASMDSLKNSPRELYITFFLKVCDSFAYFAVSQILVIYLHDEFGLSDVNSGLAYGLWGASITIWGLLTSFLNDNMGVRKSLLIGYCITFASLLAMSVTNSLSILFSCLFVFLPLGNSMGIPMLTIGIRRYTTPESRGFAYGIFYSCMNIGALLSGPVVDFFNIAYKEPVLVGGMLISGNRMVIFSCAISVCISFGTAFPFLRDVRLADPPPPVIPLFVSETHGVETVILNASPFAAEVKVNTSSSLEEFKPKQQGVLQTFRDLTRSPTFWRFSGLCLLLVNLNSIYRYLDALFPTYLIRSFGPNVPKGMLYSINPFMIILLTPLVAALFRTAKNYNMIKWGGYGTALSPLWLVASNSLWAAGLFVVTLSLGECIWAPRVYNYTMSIAPEGREASFSALATAPLFAAKIPVGILSGYLMQAYIPETGHRDPQTMWLIITVITVTSPLLITLLERYVREPEENGAVPRKDSSDGLHAGEENLGSRNPMQPPNLRHKDIQLSSPSTGVVSSPKSVFEYDV